MNYNDNDYDFLEPIDRTIDFEFDLSITDNNNNNNNNNNYFQAQSPSSPLFASQDNPSVFHFMAPSQDQPILFHDPMSVFMQPQSCHCDFGIYNTETPTQNAIDVKPTLVPVPPLQTSIKSEFDDHYPQDLKNSRDIDQELMNFFEFHLSNIDSPLSSPPLPTHSLSPPPLCKLSASSEIYPPLSRSPQLYHHPLTVAEQPNTTTNINNINNYNYTTAARTIRTTTITTTTTTTSQSLTVAVAPRDPCSVFRNTFRGDQRCILCERSMPYLNAHIGWSFAVHVALYTLEYHRGKSFFGLNDAIYPFIVSHWDILQIEGDKNCDDWKRSIHGTDDDVLVSILASRTRTQRELIAAAYGARYGHSLVHDIKGDTSFNYKDLLVGLVTPLPEYIAHLIHHAIAGLGTKEWILIDVISTTPKPILDMASVVYAEKYKTSLRDDVKDDTSGNFRKALLALIDGSKDFFSPGNPATALADAEELHRKGEGRLGTDDEYFVFFFTHSSPFHIFEVDKAYRAKYSHGLIHAIKSETSGDYQNLLIALATPPVVYWARRIRHAIAGLGTNDTLLQRAFCLNDKDALQQISQAFFQEFGKDMASEIKDDTSGWYGKLLQALLRF